MIFLNISFTRGPFLIFVVFLEINILFLEDSWLEFGVTS